MRTFVSAIAVIFALLLTGIAVPMAWTDANIVREEGFVGLTASLGKDQAFQARLAATAVGSLESKVNLPASVEQLGASFLKNAASSMSTWPEYPQAWNETVRRSHQLNFAGSAGSANSGALTSLVLDVGPLAKLAADRLRATTGLPITPPDSIQISIGGPGQRQQVDTISAYAPMWWIPALGAILLLALALLAARRRGAVVLFAGLGLAALAGLWQVAATVLKSVGDAGLGGTATGGQFAQELVTASVDNFTGWIVVAGIAGGVLSLLGLLVVILAPKARPGVRANAAGSMEG
ncbi:hypothetical protein [Arthrobacter sp. FW306-04-A]|uniref:hypothetical protein n=1 Tax=Arthrobacter sp. FW306-04-A TaxID=2879619 RepID=UPI0037C05F81|nr:hypothetical protein LFT43_14290 [Arthrobacter sp. FW306-04-A]